MNTDLSPIGPYFNAGKNDAAIVPAWMIKESGPTPSSRLERLRLSMSAVISPHA
jgi:hypothetical protein